MDPQKEEELNEIIEIAEKIASACKEPYSYRIGLRLTKRQFKRIKEKYMWTRVGEDEYKLHGEFRPSEVKSLLRKAENLARELGKDITLIVDAIRQQAYIGAMQCSIFWAQRCTNSRYAKEHLIEAKCHAREAGIDTTPEIQELEEFYGPYVFQDVFNGRMNDCAVVSLIFPVLAMVFAFVLAGPYIKDQSFMLLYLPLFVFALTISISVALFASGLARQYFLLRKIEPRAQNSA